jgi:hypothetical protein
MAEETGGEMGERAPFPAFRIGAGDDGQQVVRQAVGHMPDKRPANPGKALAETGDLQRQHEADHRVGQRIPAGGGCREDMVESNGGRDHRGGRGRTAIAAGEHVPECRGACLDVGAADEIELDRGVAVDRPPFVERHGARAEHDETRHRPGIQHTEAAPEGGRQGSGNRHGWRLMKLHQSPFPAAEEA